MRKLLIPLALLLSCSGKPKKTEAPGMFGQPVQMQKTSLRRAVKAGVKLGRYGWKEYKRLKVRQQETRAKLRVIRQHYKENPITKEDILNDRPDADAFVPFDWSRYGTQAHEPAPKRIEEPDSCEWAGAFIPVILLGLLAYGKKRSL